MTNFLIRALKIAFLSLLAGLMLVFIYLFSNALQHVELPQDGSPPILYTNQTQHDLQKTYLAAIRGAKKSIIVLTYTITDKEIISALRKKSEEGVDVTLICHQDISYDIENRIGSRVHLLKRFGKGLMHLKIMVVDEFLSFIGSSNLTGSSLKMYGNLVVGFDSKALSAYITKKALSIGKHHNNEFFKSQNFIIGGQLVELFFLPDDKNASIRIKDLIRGAKKTIQIAMFTWTRHDFAKEIISASLRGVRVEVALDNSSSKGSSIEIFELLNKSSVSIKLNLGPELLHHKFLYIDQKILVNGSANWTKNAFNVNDDCFVVIHDLNPVQKQEMDDLWKAILNDSMN